MRNLTLKQRLKQLKRRYKKVDKNRFFYNRKSDYRGYQEIVCWFLIHDGERGYSIFPFTVRRKIKLSVTDWAILIGRDHKEYKSIYSVFTQAVLPAINVRSGASWVFKALIGWTGKGDAISKTKNTNRSRSRNKTTKKRNANARHTRRR